MAILVILAGCNKPDNGYTAETGQTKTAENQQGDKIRKEISTVCREIYLQSVKDRTPGSLDSVGEMVKRLGGAGYAVVDQENQVNMENSDQVKDFCKLVGEKEEGQLTLIMVINSGGFVQFDLNTGDGMVEVSATSFSWKDGELTTVYTDNYQAYTWLYTENGYLLFEKYYMAGFSGPYAHVAVRVEALDKVYRELNRKYIYPIGYYSNNLFITDWSETDYRDLNFYDLFERLYRLEYQKNYTDSVDGKETVLQIPRNDMEKVIMKYFSIDSEELKEKAKYLLDSDAFEYKPRGLEDCCPSQEIPYPEVVDCESKEDGTLVLTVNAVWPEMNLGTAFQHKVTIRPFEDGSFQYISNQVIRSKKNAVPTWYVERLMTK